MSTVEEKLKKFQVLCEDKIRKIEALKIVHERYEEHIHNHMIPLSERTEVAKLNADLALKQLEIAKLRESIQFEVNHQVELKRHIERGGAELAEASNKLEQMMRDMAPTLAAMDERITQLTDLVTAQREGCAMGQEEARSLRSWIQAATAGGYGPVDPQVEWLERLVAATRIQSQDAQRRLDMLQQAHQPPPQPHSGFQSELYPQQRLQRQYAGSQGPW